MEIFLDTANLDEITSWLTQGVLDGVTTNPSILFKEGGEDLERRQKEITDLVKPRPVSLEVITNDPEEMLQQARTLAVVADNVVVKIPVINESGRAMMDVVSTLASEGIRTNVTACLSFGQVCLAAKAGATYASIFAGRVADEGGDSSRLIGESAEWLRHWDYPTKIIVGSIRQVSNIQDAAIAGAHIITIPPKFLAKWVDHHYSRATVHQFNEDGKKALKRAKKGRSEAPAH